MNVSIPDLYFYDLVGRCSKRNVFCLKKSFAKIKNEKMDHTLSLKHVERFGKKKKKQMRL